MARRQFGHSRDSTHGSRSRSARGESGNAPWPGQRVILNRDRIDVFVVVDRTMTWGGGYGSHAETTLSSPSMTWYLAEGSTAGDFNLFYLLQNPNAASVQATVRYLRPGGQPPVEEGLHVAAEEQPHNDLREAVDVHATRWAAAVRREIRALSCVSRETIPSGDINALSSTRRTP